MTLVKSFLLFSSKLGYLGLKFTLSTVLVFNLEPTAGDPGSDRDGCGDGEAGDRETRRAGETAPANRGLCQVYSIINLMGWEGMGQDGMGWDGMGWDEMERDGKGWDGKGWDGMGWDGMGWDGMGWDGLG